MTELVKNWNKPDEERDYLKGAELLKQFELPDLMQKHEFFKRLLHRLINDGYAEELTDYPIQKRDSLEWYQKAVVITIEGYYFITEKNGYTQRAINEANRISRQSLERRLIVFGTLLAGAYGVEEIAKIFYHHFLCFFGK